MTRAAARIAAQEFSPHGDNGDSVGIWSDGTTMWVSGFTRGTLYAYTLAGGARQATKEFNLHGDNGDPRGIWSDGTTLWVADAVDAKLYAYTLAGGARDADKEFSLHSDNPFPWGLWSDGTTMWVSDFSVGKLFAYSIAAATVASTDATLSALALSGVDIGPFSSTGYEYTASVGSGVASITVTAATTHPGATYVIKLGGVTDADGTIPLAVGENVITIEVTAQDGATTRTYTVTVTRADPAQDATLRALTGLTLIPRFSPEVEAYTASVSNDVSSVTLTATPSQAGAGASAAYRFNGADAATPTFELAVGSGNVISIVVTAADGSTTRTYTVTVTRREAVIFVSGGPDSELKSLTLRWSPYHRQRIELDKRGTTKYENEPVDGAWTRVTVAAEPVRRGAGIEIIPGDADADAPGHQVDLRMGIEYTEVRIDVSRGDQFTPYLIRVNRERSGTPGSGR